MIAFGKKFKYYGLDKSLGFLLPYFLFRIWRFKLAFKKLAIEYTYQVGSEFIKSKYVHQMTFTVGIHKRQHNGVDITHRSSKFIFPFFSLSPHYHPPTLLNIRFLLPSL